jgi:hypothetical protein
VKFDQALHSLRLGNRLRRAIWAGDTKSPDHVILSDDKLLAVSGGKGKPWVPKPEEILSDDWEGV